tara:strand:+ start:1888 stop:2880 length:993 start_codon:yes stop_codon:yes gene_type:complete
MTFLINRRKAFRGGAPPDPDGASNVDEVYLWNGSSESTYGTTYNVIDYVDRTATTGNAVDRGDDTNSGRGTTGAHSDTYAFRMGLQSGITAVAEAINYIDLTTQSGNSADVGDMVASPSYDPGSGITGDSYGFMMNRGATNSIDYIDLSTTSGDASDRGDSTVNLRKPFGVQGDTYGFSGGGFTTGASGKDTLYLSNNMIEYIDHSLTTGNASDRGDLNVARRGHCATSGSTYGYFLWGRSADSTSEAGGSVQNSIEYIDQTTTTGNGTDRGDMTSSRSHLRGSSDCRGYTNCVVGSGIWLEYFDVTTTSGNATARGERSIAGYNAGCCN